MYFGLVLHRRGEGGFASENLSILIDGIRQGKSGFREAAFTTLSPVYVRVGLALSAAATMVELLPRIEIFGTDRVVPKRNWSCHLVSIADVLSQ